MERLLDNDLAKDHYTWAGRSEKKRGFSSLTLKAVVIGKLYIFTHII
jgi:hypothetical protein